MKSDYLKFWRVIRYYIRAKYKISQADLEMLLFLYSEKYFSVTDFEKFNHLLSWDTGRFNRLRHDGWIENFRPRGHGRKALYGLTFKSTRMIQSIYRKLNGEEIPTHPNNNPLYKKKVSYSDKAYRDMITEMNKYIRESKSNDNYDIPFLDD
jgi:hypothetical protein